MITCKNNYGDLVSLPNEKFIFRPSVYGIIRNNDKICICRNRSNGKIWFPGGGIEPEETIEMALLREIREETGLENIQIGQVLGSFENYFYYQPEDLAMRAILTFYECFTAEEALFKDDQIDDKEAMNLQWIRKDQIPGNELSDPKDKISLILDKIN
jgi:8-oxo-dGTP diphosphatase